jgi:integrase
MSATLSVPGHSPGHINCAPCEAARLKVVAPAEFGLLRFVDAAPVWLGEHRREIADATLGNYRHMLVPLTTFFGELPLNEIHIGHVEEYQKWRQMPWYDERSRRTFRAGYSPINHECSTLAQIMGRAGLWIDIARFYKPLKQPKTKAGKALEPEEQTRLFSVAWSNPYWRVAYCCALITVNTTAGPGEIRHLHLSDIDLEKVGGDGEPLPTLTIRDGLKNEHRDRTIFLNGTAMAALKVLLARAHKLGCHDPEHFLLPHRAHRKGESVNPNLPMGSWKRAWQSMRAAAGLPTLRMGDLRHHAITRLLENPDVSEQTVKELAGHISKRIQNRYSHIRMFRKRDAIEAAETKAPTPQLNFDFEAIALPRPEKRKPASARSTRGTKFSTGDLA